MKVKKVKRATRALVRLPRHPEDRQHPQWKRIIEHLWLPEWMARKYPQYDFNDTQALFLEVLVVCAMQYQPSCRKFATFARRAMMNQLFNEHRREQRERKIVFADPSVIERALGIRGVAEKEFPEEQEENVN